MKTIVVGYDGSFESELALERAAEFARAFSAELVVTSVRMPQTPAEAMMPMGGMLLPPAGTDVLAAAELASGPDFDAEWAERLAGIETRLADQGVRAAIVSPVGRPIDELVDVADEWRADLIVVGTHEPGLLERIVWGSTSQAVARKAHCDVLVVHPRPREKSAVDQVPSLVAESPTRTA